MVVASWAEMNGISWVRVSRVTSVCSMFFARNIMLKDEMVRRKQKMDCART